jgi:hypothetical protein
MFHLYSITDYSLTWHNALYQIYLEFILWNRRKRISTKRGRIKQHVSLIFSVPDVKKIYGFKLLTQTPNISTTTFKKYDKITEVITMPSE